jgi:hypothetical protein
MKIVSEMEYHGLTPRFPCVILYSGSASFEGNVTSAMPTFWGLKFTGK